MRALRLVRFIFTCVQTFSLGEIKNAHRILAEKRAS